MPKQQQSKAALSNVATRGSTVPGSSAQLLSSDDEPEPIRKSKFRDRPEANRFPNLRRTSKLSRADSGFSNSGRSRRSGRDVFSDGQLKATRDWPGISLEGWGNPQRRRHTSLPDIPEDYLLHQHNAYRIPPENRPFHTDHCGPAYPSPDLHAPGMNRLDMNIPGMNEAGMCGAGVQLPGWNPAGMNWSLMRTQGMNVPPLHSPGIHTRGALFPGPDAQSFYFPGSSGRRFPRSSGPPRSFRPHRWRRIPSMKGEFDPVFASEDMPLPHSLHPPFSRERGWGFRQRHRSEIPLTDTFSSQR